MKAAENDFFFYEKLVVIFLVFFPKAKLIFIDPLLLFI